VAQFHYKPVFDSFFVFFVPPLPKQLYTEEEREKLWCYKIDKEIIYKGKVAYDISTRKGRRSLYKAEEYMRKMDERDGYPRQPWRKEIYAKKGGKLALDEKIDYIRDKS
jgi:hypothetical protein